MRSPGIRSQCLRKHGTAIEMKISPDKTAIVISNPALRKSRWRASGLRSQFT